jgi:hypothetical protein
LSENQPNGAQAVFGALVAIVGAIAQANPGCTLLKAISEAAPQLATAIPTVITACGAVIAAFSPPPTLRRRS